MKEENLKLWKALSQAKKEIGAISKDSKNPFFKSKYFDINQLLAHVEPILEKHGLMVLQPVTKGAVWSVIYHVETGEFCDSSIELPQLTDPQKLGSAITYYRRYTLGSLLSLQAEDDDGNKASKASKQLPKELIELSKKAGVTIADTTKVFNKVGLDATKSKLEQKIALNESGATESDIY